MTAEPNLTYVDEETPTLFERNDLAEEPPRGGWRNVLAVMIAIALPMEIAWFVKHKDRWAEPRQAIAALDEAGRAELAADWQRFQKLSTDEQRRLRELHAAVETDADPESLRSALADYEKWKSGLSPQQSASLVGLSSGERIDRLRALSEEQRAMAARALSPNDVKTLIAWLEGEVDKFQDRLIAAVPQQARARLESLGRRERNITLILAALNMRGGPQHPGPRFENLPLQALVELRERLSPAAQQAWDSTRSLEERKLLLTEWIRQAANKTYGNREGPTFAQRIGNVELRSFFETELTEAERNRLLALPGDEMALQLKQEFIRRRGGFKEPQPGRPPGGFGPPTKLPPYPGADRRPDGPVKPRPKGTAGDQPGV